MIDVCVVILGGVAVILAFYLFLEINYFLRTFLSVIIVRCFKKKVHVLDETSLSGICLSTDIDYLLDHMNNARYLRELDFAKIEFYQRSGLYAHVKKRGGSIFAGATTIRYRRFIKIFTRYRITTKIIYWDDQSIYIEHRFITKSDNFVNSIALCKIRIVKLNAEDVMSELIDEAPKDLSNVEGSQKRPKPEITDELKMWIESNQISSGKLRAEWEAQAQLKEEKILKAKSPSIVQPTKPD